MSSRRGLFVTLFLLLVLFSASALSLDADDKGRLVFYFLDLDVEKGSKDKSGDATLIISPDEKVMLLDTGNPQSVDAIFDLLSSLSVERIDQVVISHPHIDHLGGFPAIAGKYPIDEVYISPVVYDSSVYYQAFQEACKKYCIPVHIVQEGDEIAFGSSVVASVLSPSLPITYPEGYPENSTQFINNNSLTLQFVFGSSRALFGGDLYLGGEREVVKKYRSRLPSVLAKANHHGNDTSNGISWVKAVGADVVVAMNDVMGSMGVYNRYVKYGAVFYHTLYNGRVKVSLDDKAGVSVSPEKESWVEKGPTN